MTSVADFQTRFPEFTMVNVERIQLFLDDAALIMSSKPKWLEFYDIALQYYAAHFLVCAEATESGDTTALAPVKKKEVDDVIIERALTSVSPSHDDVYSTAYGKRYASYRRIVTVGMRGV
jgi:hypothetical protein